MAAQLTESRLIERRVLQFLLVALGLAAILIGAMLYLLGQQFNYVSEVFFETLRGQTPSSAQPVIDPTVDSELRFYAVFWLSYGVLLVWVARAILQRLRLVPILAAIFFTAGVGRLLSLLTIGAPHPLFMVLMMIELTYPLIIGFLYFRLRE